MKQNIALCYCVWDSIKPRTFGEALRLATSGLFGSVYVSEGSLLPLSRNKAVTDIFNNMPNFTHLLFIDGDMADVTPEVIEALIDADRDIIVPVMTRRSPPFAPAFDSESYEKLFKELQKDLPNRKVIEVLSAGFGCALIKREVLEKTRESTDKGGSIWFPTDRLPRDSFWDEVTKELADLAFREYPPDKDLKNIIEEIYKEGVAKGIGAHLGSIYYGEDFCFCARARTLGFKVCVHSGVYISHIGDQAYNLKDYIDFCEMRERSKDEKEYLSKLQTAKVSVWDIRNNKMVEITHGAETI